MSDLLHGRIYKRYSTICASAFYGVIIAGVITSNPSTRQQLLLLVHCRKDATHSWQNTRPSWLAKRLRHVDTGCRDCPFHCLGWRRQWCPVVYMRVLCLFLARLKRWTRGVHATLPEDMEPCVMGKSQGLLTRKRPVHPLLAPVIACTLLSAVLGNLFILDALSVARDSSV